jgi:hypothetical protein
VQPIISLAGVGWPSSFRSGLSGHPPGTRVKWESIAVRVEQTSEAAVGDRPEILLTEMSDATHRLRAALETLEQASVAAGVETSGVVIQDENVR